MRRSSRSTRTPANLSESVHQQLNMYVLAASAAGVGVLALAQPAEGKIVYTPAHVVIGINKSYDLDLNHDGITDFTIRQRQFITSAMGTSELSCFANESSNGVAGITLFAKALKQGAGIGHRRVFNRAYQMVKIQFGNSATGTHGYWVNVKNRYLGLRLKFGGTTHYGWARLNVNESIATLTGYAYETIPGKGIIAGQTKGPDDISVEEPDAALTMPTPEPATLGALAMGAPGLLIWRREERAESTQ
jgi:hypothetical protein